MLTLDVLPAVLDVIGIGEDDVSIGVEAEDRWCIVQREGVGWCVFYREDGEDYALVECSTEWDACYVLLGKMATLGYNRINE